MTDIQAQGPAAADRIELAVEATKAGAKIEPKSVTVLAVRP